MGFLASLFGKEAVEKERPEEEEEDVEEEYEDWGSEHAHRKTSAAFPRLRLGDHLEVSADGAPLLSGRIASVYGRSLVLKRERNQFAFQVCKAGTEVQIKGYVNGKIPFDLKGVVVESTKTEFKLKNLEVMTHNEFRADFRLVVNVPATLYAQEDKHLENPEECSLVDISAGGACIESEFLHGEDEVLWLKVRLLHYAPMTFLGQVVRSSEPSPGVFRYGLLFAALDDQVADSLNKMLTNIQTGNTQVHFRHDYGHW